MRVSDTLFHLINNNIYLIKLIGQFQLKTGNKIECELTEQPIKEIINQFK